MKRQDGLPLVLSIGLVWLFFGKLVLTNRVLTGVDLFTFFYPYRDYVSHALLAGRLPLWNPHIFLGVPFLADSQTALFYPLHWPLLGLSAPRAVAWSLLIHMMLAATGTYFFARRVGQLGVGGGIVAATVFSLGGFLGAQTEHINQLNTAAWLPWLLIVLDRAAAGHKRAIPAGGLLIAVMLLAGHAQAAYINLVALGLFALFRSPLRPFARSSLRPFAAMSILAVGLAAVQLLPTLELSRLSIRAGGLSYRQAGSFSFDPRLVLRGLLPTFGYDAPLFSEYVAYVGILPLLLAWFGWRRSQNRRTVRYAAAMTAGGIFLALGIFNPFYYLLYRLVPGFALFRAPARWMFFAAWGMALLAGAGADWLNSTDGRNAFAGSLRFAIPAAIIVALLTPFLQHPPPIVYVLWSGWLGVGLSLVFLQHRMSRDRRPLFAAVWMVALVIELFWARQALAYTHPTAPEAYTDMRASIAHLRTDTSLFRLLSLSALTWDPGDLGDMRAIWQDSLSERALYDLVVATKEKEILAPNLPMRYGLQSVDGYGGGILPLARYTAMQRLVLATAGGRSPGDVVVNPDGRLRERLPDVPPASLLGLLNVKYVIRDKLDDRWADGVYYDLGLKATLRDPGHPELTLDSVPDFEATGMGLVSTVRSLSSLPAGAPVAEVTVWGRGGEPHRWIVRMGQDTGVAQGANDSPLHPLRKGPDGKEYLGLWDWGAAIRPQRIDVQLIRSDVRFIVRGLTLRDHRTHTFDTVTVNPNFALSHSGDVKIYRNRQVLPRVFLAHRAEVASDESVMTALQSPNFQAQDVVYLADAAKGSEIRRSGRFPPADGTPSVVIQRYEPEQIELRVLTTLPAYLVVTDSYYPGWQAWVDGHPVPVLRADLIFRAVRLPAGQHHVRFVFVPRSVWWGGLISALFGILILVGSYGLRKSTVEPVIGIM